MGFFCGIVGLPNVGKSTLFNALTATAQADAQNYLFCTIEPNIGRVAVPDPRLEKIAALAKSAKITPTFLDFVDIAGLVRGASQGEGLGNQFLGNIREVDAICHVLRCFDDGDVTHVEDTIDPVRDAETVETELMLADLESLERRVEQAQKRAKGGDREATEALRAMVPALAVLQDGRPAREADIAPDDADLLARLNLLTTKPVLYVCNVDEDTAANGNAHSATVAEWAAARGAGSVTVAAALEAEVAQFDDDSERREFLAELGLAEAGVDRFIRAGYGLLELVTFFTAGPTETRAWTIARPAAAVDAAGQIHTDMARGFIRAETISFEDFIERGGEQGARDAGRMRAEARDYTVADGDIMLFRFNI